MKECPNGIDYLYWSSKASRVQYRFAFSYMFFYDAKVLVPFRE